MKCHWCHRLAAVGRFTCGQCGGDEDDARAAVHTARKGGGGGSSGGGRQGDDRVLARTMCGASNFHMGLRCGLRPDHEGDLHRSGNLTWRGGERPRQQDEATLARLGPVRPPGAEERLSALTQVLITVRAQMLGLGEGLRGALDRMPRAVDQHAVRGLIGALSHIVKHLDSYKIVEGETAVTKDSRLGADRITGSQFNRQNTRRPPDPDPFAQLGIQRSMAGAAEVFDSPRQPLGGSRVDSRSEGWDQPVMWRGSVSDLATDLKPLLTRAEREELARLMAKG